ncbi:MAG: ketoacyl-ACP synthase III [Acidobacteria bacterium]|nr:ketoacyl-ACP synthase III [Acidobacteriota bacterium]NIT10025.1 ketoacyl-ACP synthase III [Acidobacteriota bacterium]
MSERIYTVILGAGSHLPTRSVANSEFLTHRFFEAQDKPCDPSKSDTIVRKFEEITRIVERRYVDDHVVTSDIALRAAHDALAKTGIDKESLDYLIVAHNFGDVRADNRRSDFVPSLSARVKQRLEIHNPRCVAYDLPFGCAGWLQGVIQTDYYFRSGDAKRAMVIGAETLSRVSDPHDRDSMLYSDGAGCAILEARTAAEPVGILAHATRSDTLDHASLMWMGASFNPELEGDDLFLKMRGRKLYEYAVTRVPEVVRESLDKAGLKLGDVAKVLMHQANAKMNEAILKRLFDLEEDGEIPAGVMPMTISFLGNSSVATVPTLLDLILDGKLENQSIDSGDLVILAAVGAGMNINSVVYRWA